MGREGRRWWVSIRCVDVLAEPLAPTGRQVGIDLGVDVLVATSDGYLVTNDGSPTARRGGYLCPVRPRLGRQPARRRLRV